MEKTIRVIIVEDKLKMCEALKSFLKESPSIVVVGEAANGRELLDLLKHTHADLVLMDLEMPVMNGREALKIMQVRFPDIKVIILSFHNDYPTIKESVSLGAKGYVSKDKILTELIDSIITVNEKGFYFDEEVSSLLLKNFISNNSDYVKKLELNSREREILDKLSEGKAVKEVADELKISIDTVKYHKKNIYSKTGSHSLVQALKNTNDKNRLSA